MIRSIGIIMKFFLSNFIDLMKQLHRLTAQLSYGQDANEQVNGVLFFHENTAVPFAKVGSRT